ncbi:BTAD domain-containing putative transcriptional regulator [Paucibacter sp. APW11]|uniref:BTAD domain-containing putative transcriptional regulator n=1 Tax=Roseateles aquae TaxID=3077235 RepID=A0ABU3PB46_9BURK|nr:AAA family ATPase [Paucibacter sp. APW11]MDT8999764.1 BTAD domain-containing putative transcriptional regulator [Paucibacter sp. APW11]
MDPFTTFTASAAAEGRAPEAQGAAWLCLLGNFELRDAAGQPLLLPYEKVRVLLALLALNAGPWEREALAALLWPDTDLTQARANLRRALFDLQKALLKLLPAEELAALLVTDKRQIELRDRPALQVDTRHFALAQLDAASDSVAGRLEALRRARTLYRGPLLAQLRLESSPAMAGWLLPRREALQRQAQRCLEQLASLLEQQGHALDQAEAVEVSRDALQLDPWDEPALRRCMRLLAQQRRDEALRLYQDFAQRLSDELGLAPQDETQALAAQLREAGSKPPVAAGLQRRRVVALVCEWLADEGEQDPEALAQNLADALQAARNELELAGAWVQRAEGAELLAYFGHPEAQEHASRLALDAAQALMAAAGEQTLSARAGLHIGWVHARSEASSPDTLGELSREARRLSWAAEPGTVHVSPALHRLARQHHEFDGSAADAGYRLRGALPLRQQARRQGLQPMFGREAELAILLQCWQEARTGSMAVWLQGEPGMGKTRLLQALRAQISTQEHSAHQTLLQCLPEARHSPLQPILAGLHRMLKRLGDCPPALALRALAAQAGLAPEGLDPLLPLLWPEQGEAGIAAPHRRDTQALLMTLFERWTGGQRQLLIFEDLHWADPSTLELLERLLQRDNAAATPALLLLSSREPPPLALVTRLRTLELPPLPDDAMLNLLAQLQLPAQLSLTQLQQQVLARAQGVPLFAQALARSLIEAQGERVPATLWDLLAAKLDRLPPPLRRLAQCAAVLGSDWDAPLLAAMLPEQNERLKIGLHRLQTEGLLESRGEAHWQFRHALLRDAAYESLGPSDRRSLHRLAANALMGPFSVRAADDPAALARHLSACGDPVAAHYWLQAGRRAAAQSAHQEASHAGREGVAMLAQAPIELRRRLEAPLLLLSGASVLALEGYGSRAAHALFAQAREACAAGDDAGLQFQALWGLWLGSRSGPEEPPALALAAELQALAERSHDGAALVQARYALGNNLVFAGQLQAALVELQRATEAAERVPAAQLLARFGEHGGIASRAMSSWPLAWLGRREDAQAAIQGALAEARQLGHAQTLCFVLCMAAVLQRHWRDPQAALPLCHEMLALAERHGLQLWLAVGALVMGWAQAWQGDAAGIASIQMAVDASALAMPSTESTFLSFLSEALLRLQRPAEALARIDEALQKAPERQEHYLLAELWRMRAEALLALHPQCGDAAAADAALAQAREHAHAMGAALWQARCDAMAMPA